MRRIGRMLEQLQLQLNELSTDEMDEIDRTYRREITAPRGQHKDLVVVGPPFGAPA